MPFSDYSFLVENKPWIQKLEIEQKHNVRLSMLRLDQIHPQVSGNKIFKLIKFLDNAAAIPPMLAAPGDKSRKISKRLLTFGGPFSNHLAATAFACNRMGIRALGIVRGEAGAAPTPTIATCLRFGMEIQFMQRGEFSEMGFLNDSHALKERFGDFVFIPSGGYAPEGAAGARIINDSIPEKTYTHICVSVGTATTLAGLLMGDRKETVIAFPAIKNMQDIIQRLHYLGIRQTDRLRVAADYHFGGFAKCNDELIRFMNEFYSTYQIPLDRVYTAKMMYGVLDLIRSGSIAPGSHLLCIHTGGLQGNQSFEKNTLIF